MLEPNDYMVLEACHEAERRQQEMLPHLAAALQVKPEEVFHTWALRRCRQRGTLSDGAWGYFFHGLECDLFHAAGLFLRLDFGPGGRLDTFSAWGILMFITRSHHPWREFPELNQWIDQCSRTQDPSSGDWRKFDEAWERLEQENCFEMADPKLVDFMAQCSSVSDDGMRVVCYPPGTPETKQVDCSVAHRLRFSEHGRRLLELHRASRITVPKPIMAGAIQP